MIPGQQVALLITFATGSRIASIPTAISFPIVNELLAKLISEQLLELMIICTVVLLLIIVLVM